MLVPGSTVERRWFRADGSCRPGTGDNTVFYSDEDPTRETERVDPFMSNTNGQESGTSARSRDQPPAHDDAEGSRHASATGPENHLALIYETPAEQLSAIVPFVRQGLEANERVMYIADESSVADLRAAFAGAGIDVESALDSGALSFHSASETYAPSGSFDIDEMMDLLDELVRDVAAGDEYDRIRITGEMTWALGDDADTLDHLVEYEATVNDFYPEKPAIALCQYDRTRFPPDLLHDIVRAHPHQVYNATVTQNFAYLPPEEFFAAAPPSADTDAFLEAHLDRIQAHRRRQQHEEAISALAASSHDLLLGETEEILDRATATVRSVLSPAVVAVHTYDDATDTLQPESVWLPPGGESDSVSLPDEYRELLRETFVSDDATVFSNQQSLSELPALNAVVQSGVAYPLGRHGVLFVGSTQAYAFEQTDVEFVRTVAHATEAALDRAEHQRTLERQNEQLRHLDRINRTIRHIDQALVRASSREEVETVVCDRLTHTDAYAFAWIGDRDPLTDQFVPRQWAGDGEPYLDELHTGVETSGSERADDPDVVPSPTRTALESKTTQFVPNTLITSEYPAWRRAALANGLYAAVSVPLVHNDAEYGVLSVYASEPNALTEMEREVLRELGATVAYAIDAAETKASLHANRHTEVSLRITDSRSRLLRLAREIGGSLAVETVLPEADGELRLFFTVADVPAERVLSAAEDAVSVKAIRQISDRSQGVLFEAILDVPSSIPTTMASFNGSVTRFDATPDGVELVVELPQVADVREFVERFEADYPDTTVTSIRRITEPFQTRETFSASVEERLTDRQLEALRLAYHSGYFEWPRDSSATDVAESMGVTQPTFNGHLRVGERKLLELLFESHT